MKTYFVYLSIDEFGNDLLYLDDKFDNNTDDEIIMILKCIKTDENLSYHNKITVGDIISDCYGERVKVLEIC